MEWKTKVDEVHPGDTVKLVKMPGDPDPLPDGIEGKIVDKYVYDSYAFLRVAWDNGRQLPLICPPDDFEIV